MVKLDVSILRYLNSEDFRVLVAIEMGMRNHELVPTTLIERIAQLRHGGCKKVISHLLKFKLIQHEAKIYDGYSLNYPGYDFLALKAFVKRGHLYGVGHQVGIGKESDIYIVVDQNEKECILKLHRLGRTSFRAVKTKRDYLKHRNASTNWLYLSRLSALKEFAFMKALYEKKFPVPVPIDCNRHCILMSVVEGYPMHQVKEMADVKHVFNQCIDIIVRLAEHGLIHGDFNEFNLMVTDEGKVTMIDFPQMVSTSHENANMYFDRDIQCIHTFFNKRFTFESDYFPSLSEILKTDDLDINVEASGFSKNIENELHNIYHGPKDKDDSEGESEEEEGEEENDMDENVEGVENKKTESEIEKSTELVEKQNTKDGETAAIEIKGDVDLSDNAEDPHKEEEVNDDITNIEEQATEESNELPLGKDEIKLKVKRQLNKKGKRTIIKGAKRNAQKGKSKRNAKREVNSYMKDF